MATITVTGVEGEVKRALTIACVERGTSVSRELRDRLPRIIDEVRGDEVAGPDPRDVLGSIVAELKMTKRINEILTMAVNHLPEAQRVELIAMATAEIREAKL